MLFIKYLITSLIIYLIMECPMRRLEQMNTIMQKK